MAANKNRAPRTGEAGPNPAAGAHRPAPRSTSSGEPTDAREAGLRAILAVEDRIRAATDEAELVHLIANETRRLVAARQIIVLRRAAGKAKFRAAAISSLSTLDRDTPFLRWVEALVHRLVQEKGDGETVEFALPAFVDEAAAETRTYPFPELLWQPLKLASGETFAGLLLARETPWRDADRQVLAREAQVFANAWAALAGPARLRPKTSKKRWLIPLAALAVAALCAMPVPMTTLAPVEIIAAQPNRLTAPIDGVIKAVLFPPNAVVKAGDRIVLFDDTELRNRLSIAEREMSVARARYDRARQAAFSDEEARHDLAISLNAYRLKKAERDFAADQLARTTISAERGGILIYSDQDRLLGRPVKTGERLMEIADPSDVAARIDLAVADAIVLRNDASVRLFLDADPLNSIPATLRTKAYHAEPNSTQKLVYRLYADPAAGRGDLRIGARGTAQLYGDDVPLIYFLLRRPIAAVRQYIGL